MALLSLDDQRILRETFADLKHPVTLLFVTQTIGCETCEEASRILAEVTTLTDKVTVEEVNLVLDRERALVYGIDRAPGIIVLANGSDTRIRFLGSPGGYDFMSLVDAVLLAGGGSEQALSDDSLALVAGVKEPTHIQVFVTPT